MEAASSNSMNFFATYSASIFAVFLPTSGIPNATKNRAKSRVRDFSIASRTLSVFFCSNHSRVKILSL